MCQWIYVTLIRTNRINNFKKKKCTKNIVSLTLLDAPIPRERATLTSQSIGAKWTTRVQAFARCVLERVERPQGVKFNPVITHGGPYKPQCSHIYTLIISIFLSIIMVV